MPHHRRNSSNADKGVFRPVSPPAKGMKHSNSKFSNIAWRRTILSGRVQRKPSIEDFEGHFENHDAIATTKTVVVEKEDKVYYKPKSPTFEMPGAMPRRPVSGGKPSSNPSSATPSTKNSDKAGPEMPRFQPAARRDSTSTRYTGMTTPKLQVRDYGGGGDMSSISTIITKDPEIAAQVLAKRKSASAIPYTPDDMIARYEKHPLPSVPQTFINKQPANPRNRHDPPPKIRPRSFAEPAPPYRSNTPIESRKSPVSPTKTPHDSIYPPLKPSDVDDTRRYEPVKMPQPPVPKRSSRSLGEQVSHSSPADPLLWNGKIYRFDASRGWIAAKGTYYGQENPSKSTRKPTLLMVDKDQFTISPAHVSQIKLQSTIYNARTSIGVASILYPLLLMFSGRKELRIAFENESAGESLVLKLIDMCPDARVNLEGAAKRAPEPRPSEVKAKNERDVAKREMSDKSETRLLTEMLESMEVCTDALWDFREKYGPDGFVLKSKSTPTLKVDIMDRSVAGSDPGMRALGQDLIPQVQLALRGKAVPVLEALYRKIKRPNTAFAPSKTADIVLTSSLSILKHLHTQSLQHLAVLGLYKSTVDACMTRIIPVSYHTDFYKLMLAELKTLCDNWFFAVEKVLSRVIREILPRRSNVKSIDQVKDAKEDVKLAGRKWKMRVKKLERLRSVAMDETEESFHTSRDNLSTVIDPKAKGMKATHSKIINRISALESRMDLLETTLDTQVHQQFKGWAQQIDDKVESAMSQAAQRVDRLVSDCHTALERNLPPNDAYDKTMITGPQRNYSKRWDQDTLPDAELERLRKRFDPPAPLGPRGRPDDVVTQSLPRDFKKTNLTLF